MSILKELEEAAGIIRGRTDSEQDHAGNLLDKISKISQEEWDALSTHAQAWYNEAVSLVEDGKEVSLPEQEEKPAARSRRGATEAAAPAPWVPKKGEAVVVTTKRGQIYEGEFMELDGDTAIVKVAGEEMEFTASRTASMIPAKAAVEEEAASEPQVGDLVTITTKRNAVVSGKLIELTDEVVVLEVDGKEAEYDRARVASIVVETDHLKGKEEEPRDPVVGDVIDAVTKRNKEVHGKVVEIEDNILIVDMDGQDVEVDINTAKSLKIVSDEKEEKPAARSRRGATEAAAPAPTRGKRETTPVEEKEEKKKTTKADNGGISIGARIREVICENPDAKVEAISKLLERKNWCSKKLH